MALLGHEATVEQVYFDIIFCVSQSKYEGVDMQKFKLANVLFETNPRSVNYPSLYCRATAPIIQSRATGLWTLCGPGSFDFATYFNSVSIAKWRKYTVMNDLYLHLELRGAPCKVWTSHAGYMSRAAEPSSTVFELTEGEDGWMILDTKVPVEEHDILVAFTIETEGELAIRNSYYYTEVEPSAIHAVELALSTTTFKKEDFILNNIALLKEAILESDELIASHFHMHVVDNGSTLDATALSTDKVTIYPNSNVGGSGGFAYGMIAALEQNPPATNVLLMDDDVAVSPESIIRTFNLLSLLKDEYKESFISGAMLNYDIGEDQWEDMGFMTDEGRFSPIKPPIRVTQLNDLLFNETFQGDKAWDTRKYAAWWYCCIPTDVIRREGLPLPLFVRCDDAEYSIRCQPNFITMNGICIWHLSFHARYNAAVERYQTTRNTLIAQATTGMAPESDFILELRNNMQIELKKFNYTNAELLLDGFEDFMKGPDFIGTPGKAEECFMRSNKKAEKLLPFDELQKEIDALDDKDLSLDLHAITEAEVMSDKPRTRGQALVDFISFNGQRTFLGANARGVSVIPAAGWMYPAGKIRKKDILISIDQYNRKGVIRKKDKARFDEIMERYKADLKYYKQHKERIEAEYAAARDRLTSIEFWRHYLGIQ